LPLAVVQMYTGCPRKNSTKIYPVMSGTATPLLSSSTFIDGFSKVIAAQKIADFIMMQLKR